MRGETAGLRRLRRTVCPSIQVVRCWLQLAARAGVANSSVRRAPTSEDCRISAAGLAEKKASSVAFSIPGGTPSTNSRFPGTRIGAGAGIGADAWYCGGIGWEGACAGWNSGCGGGWYMCGGACGGGWAAGGWPGGTGCRGGAAIAACRLGNCVACSTNPSAALGAVSCS